MNPRKVLPPLLNISPLLRLYSLLVKSEPLLVPSPQSPVSSIPSLQYLIIIRNLLDNHLQSHHNIPISLKSLPPSSIHPHLFCWQHSWYPRPSLTPTPTLPALQGLVQFTGTVELAPNTSSGFKLCQLHLLVSLVFCLFCSFKCSIKVRKS